MPLILQATLSLRHLKLKQQRSGKNWEKMTNSDLNLLPLRFIPLTGELYIIASVNHVLVILNKDHSVKNAYKIDPALFKQPEGLTFTPKGDLIISNEVADRGAAEILFFKYNKLNNRQ